LILEDEKIIKELQKKFKKNLPKIVREHKGVNYSIKAFNKLSKKMKGMHEKLRYEDESVMIIDRRVRKEAKLIRHLDRHMRSEAKRLLVAIHRMKRFDARLEEDSHLVKKSGHHLEKSEESYK